MFTSDYFGKFLFSEEERVIRMGTCGFESKSQPAIFLMEKGNIAVENDFSLLPEYGDSAFFHVHNQFIRHFEGSEIDHANPSRVEELLHSGKVIEHHNGIEETKDEITDFLRGEKLCQAGTSQFFPEFHFLLPVLFPKQIADLVHLFLDGLSLKERKEIEAIKDGVLVQWS